ncbi:response regulator [Diplocloster modestus]|uniref:Stage 0 sporulation protein A homolog n=1 Tax=Diplocloster modestus TaxID=2850322 RepID=A0ABS6K6X9_9FIRM|nr:response regulator [Diplocloster modestus]MBU9726265.1 response regulator [Diplocloster modestus]
MLDIVVVDDDMIVRKGIIKSIDWEKIGCEIVGEASNGKTGLQVIQEKHPQIAIIDIKMPVMDGLELARILSETMPEVRILILTGYSEFDYAREALRLGVKNYLLKPVKAEEMMENILEVKEKIQEEQEIFRQIEEKNKIMSGSIDIIRTYFLQQVLEGQIPIDDEFHHRAKELQLDFKGPAYQVIVVDIDDYSAIVPSNSNQQLKKMHEKIGDLFDRIFWNTYKARAFFTHDNYLCGIVNRDVTGGQNITEDCRTMQKKTKVMLNTSVTVSIGDVQEKLECVPDSFTKAMTALKMKSGQRQGAIIKFSEIEAPGENMNIDLKAEEQMLLDGIKGLDSGKTAEVIDQIFQKVREHNANYEQLKNLAVRQVIVALLSVENMGVDFQDILGKNASILDELNNCRVMNDIRIWLKDFMEKLVQQLKSMNTFSYSSVVATAIQYVASHYQSEIRVEQLADLVYVTPNYFSRVFYQETGVHFADYLNQYRISKAKLLFREKHLKTYEIAELCGYQNYKYFSFIFKKYEKCSPRQFREKMERTLP